MLEKWIKEGYTVEQVEFDGDLKEFKVKQAGVVQTITPATVEDMEDIIDALNDGECVDGWENGMGEVIYIKEVDELTLKEVYEFIQHNYEVDGENEKYATYFENKEDVADQMDIEIFEEKFDVKVDEVQFPVITIDNANAADGHIFYTEDKEEVIEFAKNYFEAK